MIDTLKNILNIKASINVNSFIYFLKKIPIIKKLIKDNAYEAIEAKKILTIIATVFKGFGGFFTKLLYVGLMIFLPALLINKKMGYNGLNAFTNIFIFMSFIIPLFINNDIFNTNADKFTCVKLMRMNARKYIISTSILKYTLFFFYFIPALTIFSAILGAPLWCGLIYTFALVAWRMVILASHVFVFDKLKIVVAKNTAISVSGCIAFFLAAYMLPFFNVSLITSDMVINPIAIIIITALGAFCGNYLYKYKNYRDIVDMSTKLDDPLLNMEKTMAESTFANVKLKDTDLTKESIKNGKFSSKTGYDYLNAIFFDRHKRLLVKPMFIRLAIIAVLTVAGIICVIISSKFAKGTGKLFNNILPAFVFIMYATSSAERICKSMFYNCDISLLRYSYYRKRNVILKNFKSRLLMVCGINIVPAIAIGIGMTLIIMISGADIRLSELIPFILSIICLSLFFSVHHLCMYYIFQPYTTELNVKNPFYNLINGFIYALSYFCLQIHAVPKYFAFIVLLATVIYMATALILVYKLAYKTFKVK